MATVCRLLSTIIHQNQNSPYVIQEVGKLQKNVFQVCCFTVKNLNGLTQLMISLPVYVFMPLRNDYILQGS